MLTRLSDYNKWLMFIKLSLIIITIFIFIIQLIPFFYGFSMGIAYLGCLIMRTVIITIDPSFPHCTNIYMLTANKTIIYINYMEGNWFTFIRNILAFLGTTLGMMIFALLPFIFIFDNVFIQKEKENENKYDPNNENNIEQFNTDEEKNI